MTAYVYAVKAITDLGLDPEKDVTLIQSQPGSETVPLLKGDADFAFTLEPAATKATEQGAHIILSFPEVLGDQVFTGLMTTEQYIRDHHEIVVGVVRAYQRALDNLHSEPSAALATAQKYFPQLPEQTLRTAISRLVSENVIPATVEISEDSWKRAVAVRRAAGDLKADAPRDVSCDLEIMAAASKR